MKSIVKWSPVLIMLIISSCQTAKWGNFNRQKYTGLKRIKVEKNRNQWSDDNSSDEVKNEIETTENETTTALVIFTEDSIVKPYFPTDEVSSEVEQQLFYAEAQEMEIIINVNGKDYFLKNWQYNSEEKVLRGLLTPVASLPKDAITLYMEVDQYEIEQMNGLKADLSQLTVPNPYPIETKTVETTERNDSGTQNSTDTSSIQPTSQPVNPVQKPNSKGISGSARSGLVATGIIFFIAAIILGGAAGGALLVFGIVFLLIAVSSNFNQNQAKRNKSTSINNASHQIATVEEMKKAERNGKKFFGLAVLCLVLIGVGILITLWWVLLGLVIGVISYIVGYSLIAAATLHFSRQKRYAKALNKQRNTASKLLYTLSWLALIGFSILLLFIPLIIASIIIHQDGKR